MATNLERYGVFALIFVVLLIVSISIWGPDETLPEQSTAAVSVADELGETGLGKAWNGGNWESIFQGSVQEEGRGLEENPIAPPRTGIREYKVRKGDNPSKIAKQFYGKESLFTRILEANPGLQPRRLQPGQVILIPDPPAERDPLEGAILEPENETRNVLPQGDEDLRRTAQRTHRVRKGERLSEIAKQYYGTSTMTQPIVDANERITDPDRIGEGWVLVIPERQ